jgi:hypothetical protein
MTITQTVEVTDSRLLTLEVPVPREVPNGQTNITIQFPVKNEAPIKKRMTAEEEIELINRHADKLNREAMDVLSYQADLW